MISGYRIFKRIIAGVFTVLLMLAPDAAVFSSAYAEETESVYKAPKLSSSAEPYDEEHPELLQANQLYAKSAILVEATTGKVIFEKDADVQRYPASTTKIMTVYLGVLYGDMDATAYLTDEDMQGIEVGVDADMDLQIGESINFKELLYGTFIRSANEGANLIAETVSGDISTFVALMNETAQNLGCTSTQFVNPNGLHNTEHYTTARDMAKIACEAMKNDAFRDIAGSVSCNISKSNLQRARLLTHSSRKFIDGSLEDNEYYYPGATGIKTGYTSAAGYCYVGSAEKNGVELISVVFYTTETGRWTDTKKLLDYGFSMYTSVTPEELYAQNPITVITTGFAMNDEGYGRLQLNAEPLSGESNVKIIATKNELTSLARQLRQTVSIEYTRDFSAPIEQGEEIGRMTYYPEDGGSVEYRLVASRSIAERENKPLSLEEIEWEVQNDPNPFPPLSVELVLMFLIPAAVLYLLIRLLMMRFGKKKKRKDYTIPKPTGREFR